MHIDLHCHSTASDGALAPAAVVRRAYEHGVRVLALTDHDTLEGLAEATHAERGRIGGKGLHAGDLAQFRRDLLHDLLLRHLALLPVLQPREGQELGDVARAHDHQVGLQLRHLRQKLLGLGQGIGLLPRRGGDDQFGQSNADIAALVGHRQGPLHITVRHDNPGHEPRPYDIAPHQIGLNEIPEGFRFNTILGKTLLEFLDRKVGPACEILQPCLDVLFGEFDAIGHAGFKPQPVIDQTPDGHLFQIARRIDQPQELGPLLDLEIRDNAVVDDHPRGERTVCCKCRSRHQQERADTGGDQEGQAHVRSVSLLNPPDGAPGMFAEAINRGTGVPDQALLCHRRCHPSPEDQQQC